MSERELRVELPVVRATLFEDRAELVRRATFAVEPGATILRAPGVTPLTSPKRLRATATASSGAVRIDDVRLDRRAEVVRSGSEVRRRTHEAARAAAERAVAAADRALRRAEKTASGADVLMTRYAERIGRSVWSAGAGAAERWRVGLEALEAHADAAAAEVDRRRGAQREAVRARDALAADAGRDEEVVRPVAELVVHLDADSRTEVTLEIAGVVPCAVWRPGHEAHLIGEDRLRWTTIGTVWQQTGEDWRGVELELSTARPGAGSALPTLSSDRLRAQPKADPHRIVLQHRREKVATDRGQAGMPGVYDGGEPRTFTADGPVDIPSDGRPHRVAAGGFEADAVLSRVCRPEVSRHVFMLAQLENRSPGPLLAGPVTLLRDGAYAGIGDLSYVGPGDPLELSFGSDDHWRVTFRRRRDREKRRLGRDRAIYLVEVELSYAGPDRSDVELALRLPISDLPALRIVPVDASCTEGRPAPDDSGHVHVPVELRSGQRREISLGFCFEKSGDVHVPAPW